MACKNHSVESGGSGSQLVVKNTTFLLLLGTMKTSSDWRRRRSFKSTKATNLERLFMLRTCIFFSSFVLLISNLTHLTKKKAAVGFEEGFSASGGSIADDLGASGCTEVLNEHGKGFRLVGTLEHPLRWGSSWTYDQLDTKGSFYMWFLFRSSMGHMSKICVL